jgi:nucleoside-diphosphate-sugar epimerase
VKAAITGVNGFVGSHLAEGLLAAGDDVVGVLRESSNRDNLSGVDLQLRFADLRDEEALRGAVRDVEVLYHVAGVTKAKNLQQLDNVNVVGTAKVLDAAIAAGVRRVVLVSSGEAAGPGSREAPVSEGMPAAPVSNYGRSKRGGELEAWKRADGCELVIVRPPTVYGPRDTDMLENLKVVKLGIAPTYGLGREFVVSLIHARDLAAALRLAAFSSERVDPAEDPERPTGGGVFHVDDGSPISWAALSHLQARLMDRRAVTIAFPAWIQWIAAAGSEGLGRLRGRVPILNRDKWRAAQQVGWVMSTERARGQLGFEAAIDLESGMAETIEWYRSRGLL